MSQLIGIIIAILLGAIVTAFAYVYLGSAYTEQSTKAEAQKILNQAEQIEAALIAYKVDNGGVIKLGPSEMENPEDNEIFKYLVQDGYLKESVNSSIDEQTMYWHLYDPTPAEPNSGDETIQRVVQDVEQCILANHLRNNTPKEGVSEGFVFNTGGTVGASDVVDGVISCDSALAANVSCCIK